MTGPPRYQVHVARFESGERFPVLLYQDTLQPVMLVTRYILDECRQRSQASTLLRTVRVLKWFYEWCGTTGINLETQLRRGRLPDAGEITGFCRHLRTPRVAGGMAVAERAAITRADTLSPATFNFYLSVVERFLIWAAYEFIPLVADADKAAAITETTRERIRRAFRSNKVAGRSVRKRYGLDDAEVDELRKAIRPESRQNPFKPAMRIRNQVIVELMLATGLRRGEVLKLKIGHLPKGPKDTLTVERAPDEKGDSRRNEPAVKTREREIPIPKALALALWRYVQKERKTGTHSYLFTSQRGGTPLDASGLNGIFRCLVRRCFPRLHGKLHPHNIRHTFNNRLIERARDLGWSDSQLQKVQAYLNGWTEGSVMPEIYSRTVIEAQARELAEHYQAELYRS